MPDRSLNSQNRIVALAFLLGLATCAPAVAANASTAPDTYSEIDEPDLKAAYLEALSAAGESSSGKLVHYLQRANPATGPADGTGGGEPPILVHAVQDRGLPRGEEYPTFVFKTVGKAGPPELVHKLHAETRIYHADAYGDTGCLFSAKKGYSDVCLADVQGSIAPDLPGLRKDFWSDLMKLLGL